LQGLRPGMGAPGRGRRREPTAEGSLMAQLLIELFSEEIPARMQLQAAKDFERLMGGKLNASGLTFDRIRGYAGPRRLALVVDGLPAQTQAVSEEVKGPREGAPPQALEGFLRKVGLSRDEL